MTTAKETITPMASNNRLKLNDGTGPAETTTYRQLVGSFQYLSLTRPDVANAINKLPQYMHSPTQQHWMALKRILRYLKGTLHYDLSLSKHSTFTLIALSDANWAGNLDDKTLTTGYILFLGKNLVSWKSVSKRQ